MVLINLVEGALRFVCAGEGGIRCLPMNYNNSVCVPLPRVVPWFHDACPHAVAQARAQIQTPVVYTLTLLPTNGALIISPS